MQLMKHLFYAIFLIGGAYTSSHAQVKTAPTPDVMMAKEEMKSDRKATRIDNEALAKTWDIVAKSNADIERSEAKRSQQNCDLQCQGLSQAKDLVISADPDLRKDKLLAYFEKLKACNQCSYVPEIRVKSRGMDPLMQCFAYYASAWRSIARCTARLRHYK